MRVHGVIGLVYSIATHATYTTTFSRMCARWVRAKRKRYYLLRETTTLCGTKHTLSTDNQDKSVMHAESLTFGMSKVKRANATHFTFDMLKVKRTTPTHFAFDMSNVKCSCRVLRLLLKRGCGGDEKLTKPPHVHLLGATLCRNMLVSLPF